MGGPKRTPNDRNGISYATDDCYRYAIQTPSVHTAGCHVDIGWLSLLQGALTMASQRSGSMFQPFPFGALADRKAYACPAVRPLPTQRPLILIDCPVPFTKSLTLFGFIISDRRLPDVADELITISPQSSDFFFCSVPRFQDVIGPNAQPKIPCMASSWIRWRTLAKNPWRDHAISPH